MSRVLRSLLSKRVRTGGFVPADRSTLRQLTKFAGSGGGLTINFDAMLLGERIFWDAATDTLTIKGTPPNLRDQLQRRGNKG